jgi:CDGSH-type Zn-finger protein/mannose-6-phosphate isomerase-like protein (cupin superfamily)
MTKLEPVIARTKPCYAELRQGRTYYWCTCGRSKRQPYCDGSHAGTEFQPLAYTARDDEEVLLCGCKRTGTPPFCDGSHNNLPGAYSEDDPTSEANRAIVSSTITDGARTMLDGECYVFRPSTAHFENHDNTRWCTIIGPQFGARYQSQFCFDVDTGISAPASFGARHVVLFVQSGSGRVHIGKRKFDIARTDGVYVRPGEAFALEPAGCALRVFVSACPAAEAPTWLDKMPDMFDAAHEQRVVRVDTAKRNAMGARFFQMLVDKSVGSTVATQFIGEIPFSKAEPHRHLYEEALILVDGHGCLWTETLKAPVHAGDVMFLPRKQLHSLQCLERDGMFVAGVIYPGDNPSINY